MDIRKAIKAKGLLFRQVYDMKMYDGYELFKLFPGQVFKLFHPDDCQIRLYEMNGEVYINGRREVRDEDLDSFRYGLVDSSSRVDKDLKWIVDKAR